MSVQACAELVHKGDPDRFRATMAAPPPARRVLFPLYAYNLEVARAPWAASEPMIAEMRLQFWRDVAEEIGQGKPPRAHEVVEPLADILRPEDAPLLDAIAAARRWDIYRDAFEDEAHFDSYIDATSGNLIWAAARALGAPAEAEPVIRDLAWGAGVANFLRAVPELEARGRVPLLDGRPEGVTRLANRALNRFEKGLTQQTVVPKPARPALYAAWLTTPILRQAQKAPTRVASGALAVSPFSSRLRLLRPVFLGTLR